LQGRRKINLKNQININQPDNWFERILYKFSYETVYFFSKI
jgi:hypothetical protein